MIRNNNFECNRDDQTGQNDPFFFTVHFITPDMQTFLIQFQYSNYNMKFLLVCLYVWQHFAKLHYNNVYKDQSTG